MKNTDLFRCPICSSKMDIDHGKSLICLNNHCFDLARSGYVNFLTRPVKTEYDKTMFKSRSIISKSGFFEPMVDAVADKIADSVYESDSGRMTILDAGCGEGSHLYQITENYIQKRPNRVNRSGMDISRKGFKSLQAISDCIWCVD